jgi:hypothetical protein
MNHSLDSAATVANAPGSSKRCPAPGITSNRLIAAASWSRARLLCSRVTPSPSPTISRVGDVTWPRSCAARSVRPPRETIADTICGRRAAAMNAAAAPVLDPINPIRQSRA